MLVWRHHMFSEDRSAHRALGERVTFGRRGCDVPLPSAYVADHALTLFHSSRGWEIETVGDTRCNIAGITLQPGDRTPLPEDAEVQLTPYVLRFEHNDDAAADPLEEAADLQIAELIREIHGKLLDQKTPGEIEAARTEGGESLLRIEHAVDEIAGEHELYAPEQDSRLFRLAGHAVRNVIIDRVIGEAGLVDPLGSEQRSWVRFVSGISERESELLDLAVRLESSLKIVPSLSVPTRMALIERRYWDGWHSGWRPLNELVHYLATKELKKQVKDLLFGYGAIEDLLRMPTISEIMVVGHETIFVEKRLRSGGTMENSGRRFVSERAAIAVIERIASRCNRRIDQSQPMVDARLDDGSRVNAVIPPIAVSGPTLTIRKFPKRQHRIDDWIESGGLTPMAAAFLRSAVRGRKNILVSGGTGAGKTTLLNCFADWISERERVVTIEDTAELKLAHDHVVTLQTRPANVAGQGSVSTRDLVRNALRMRPDRIVVGECRGGEAFDMLNAMNTGHDGSMTTLHANSPDEVPLRLESMVKSAGDYSEASIHQQIASAIDLIVQIERFRGDEDDEGRRLVASIAEVREVDPTTGRVRVTELFNISRDAGSPELRSTGRLPTFGAELMSKGLLGLELFCPDGEAA